MNILPSLEEVKRIAATGEYNVLPVSCEILSDRRTPIETLRVLKTVSSHCYMLESVVEREKWGRYTFLGYDPKLEVTCIRGEMKVGDLRFHTEDPSAQLRQLLLEGTPKQDEPGRLLGPVTPLFDKPTYRAMVERAKHYIREGDIFQIVLSNRLSAPFSGTLLDTYRILRTTNPSPYMFYFSGTDVEVAGASPETLVKLEDGVIDVAQYGKDAPAEVGKYVKTMKDALR